MMIPASTIPTTSRLGRLLAGIALMGSTAVAVAQPVRNSRLEPVDPGYGDTSPLRVSTRMLQVEMRTPSGFDRVYRVPGSTGGVGSMDVRDDRFARVSGGISAVFPRSEYVTTKDGTFAMVPAGTVYYIGGIPDKQRPTGAGRAVAPGRGGLFSLAASTAAPGITPTRAGAAGTPSVGVGYMDLRVPDAGSPDAERARVSLRPDAPAPASNVLADDGYRRARMRQLLAAAAHPE